MGMLALMMFFTTLVSLGIIYILTKWMFRKFEEE